MKKIILNFYECEHYGDLDNYASDVEASTPQYGGFPARMMCVMFDDRMSYCKDKLNIERFKAIV